MEIPDVGRTKKTITSAQNKDNKINNKSAPSFCFRAAAGQEIVGLFVDTKNNGSRIQGIVQKKPNDEKFPDISREYLTSKSTNMPPLVTGSGRYVAKTWKVVYSDGLNVRKLPRKNAKIVATLDL